MKFTNAQVALLHAAESLGVSVLITMLTALYQYFILHGFNVQGLISVGIVSFVGAFGMLYKSLLANPNLGPATIDTVNELKDTLAQHTKAISSLQAAVQQSTAVQQAPVQAQVQQAVQAPVTPVPVPQLQFIAPNRSFTNLELPAIATAPMPVPTSPIQ